MDLSPLYPGYRGTPGQVPSQEVSVTSRGVCFCFLPPAHLPTQALPWCQVGVPESLGLSTPLTKLQFLSSLAPAPQLPHHIPEVHLPFPTSPLSLPAQPPTPAPYSRSSPSLTSHPQHSSCSPLSQFLSGSVPTPSSANSLCLA